MSSYQSYSEAREQIRDEIERIPAQISLEYAAIDARVQAGQNLVVNVTGGHRTLVHQLGCSTVAHQLNRDEAWSLVLEERRMELENPNFVPHTLNEVPGKMPNLMSKEEVEDLTEYRACGSCQPLLTRREKKRPRQVRFTKLQSLGPQHYGREFVAADGTYLGQLREVQVVAEFTSGILRNDTTEVVSMVPQGASAESIQQQILE